MKPLKPSARRVLAFLLAAGADGATTHQLCQPHVGGTRFGARIHEIRAYGYRVVERRERPGTSRYRIVTDEELAA